MVKANIVKRDKSERKLIPDTKSIAAKKRSEEFLLQEVKTTMRNLQSTLKTDIKHLSDDEVKERQSGLLKLIEGMENLSKMVHNLLECSNSVEKDEVDEIMANYSNISLLKEYFKDINNEVKNRETTKQKLFDESKLRINLPTFSGYESKLDIYSFQSEVLKIYEQTTPKQMLPDLLKNNLLEGSALSLVKSMKDIEDMWKRLKGAYGDPILLLKKKLSQIRNISQLWKIRHQEKLVNALSKIINMMRELHQIAEQHNMKPTLYSDDRLERIHQMMCDSRVTRWLSTICEVEYNDEQTWHHLIELFQRDLKVQQQKLIIQNKSENKRQKQAYEEKGHIGRCNSHFTGN